VPLPLYYPRSIRRDIIEIFPETYSTCTTERNDERQSCRKMGFNFVGLCWHQAEGPTQDMAIVPRDKSEWVQGIRLVEGRTVSAVVRRDTARRGSRQTRDKVPVIGPRSKAGIRGRTKWSYPDTYIRAVTIRIGIKDEHTILNRRDV